MKGEKMKLLLKSNLLISLLIITSGTCKADDLTISIEQQLMVAGSVKGVGCVTVKNSKSVSDFDKKKAMLIAKSTLLDNKYVSGTEQVSINSDYDDNYKIKSNHFSYGERVTSNEPSQVYYFHGSSEGYYCVKV